MSKLFMKHGTKLLTTWPPWRLRGITFQTLSTALRTTTCGNATVTRGQREQANKRAKMAEHFCPKTSQFKLVGRPTLGKISLVFFHELTYRQNVRNGHESWLMWPMKVASVPVVPNISSFPRL